MDGKGFVQWRERMAWSQRQAAHAIGIKRSEVQLLESAMSISSDLEHRLLILQIAAEQDEKSLEDLGKVLPPAWIESVRHARRVVADTNSLPSRGRPRRDPVDTLITALDAARPLLAKGAETLDSNEAHKIHRRLLMALEELKTDRMIDQIMETGGILGDP